MVEKALVAAKTVGTATVGGDESPPVVGVLMLETRFPRFAGDIGGPGSLPYPTRHRAVPSASVGRVIDDAPLPPALLERFVVAGRELAAEGVSLLVTSCGFLHAAQETLARALPVPIITSSLVLLEQVHALHGGNGPVGILTFDARRLGARHLGAGARLRPVVQGMERSPHFHPVIAEDRVRADRGAMERDAIAAARQLARARPGAVVLECTNLSPYRAAIERALGGVPVFDLHDAIRERME